MADFQRDWKTRIACEENKSWAHPDRKTRGYLVTDGKSGVVVTVSAQPLPAHLVDLTARVAKPSSDDRSALLGHKAYIRVDFGAGSGSPVERARFSSQVVLSLLHIPQALGYINVSGQLYHTTKKAEPLRGSEEDLALFLACVGVQDVIEPGGHWLHTHGMEQFGLPDIEVKFRDEQQRSYYSNLLRNFAAYSMQHGPVLKVGDTAELAGDGVIYHILPVAPDPVHEYGHYVAIRISPSR